MKYKTLLNVFLKFFKGRNIFSLYLKVWAGYIVGFFIFMAILSVPLLIFSGGNIHLFTPAFFRNGFSGLLIIAAISSFFSVLEVQRLRAGWFCYGLLLAGFIYFSFNQHLLVFIPKLIRSIWLPVLIIHPFMYLFAGGKFVERMFMTEEQRGEAEISDEYWYESFQRMKFDQCESEYSKFSVNEKERLKGDGVYDANSYAEKKLGRKRN